LRHQTRLQPHLRIAHIALNFGARNQGGDRIDHHHIQRPAADQGLGDLQGLLAGVRLGDKQILRVHPQQIGVMGVQRMLGIDESRKATRLLRLSDDVQGQRGLAR